MTPREKLLKIAAKVHLDAAEHREYAAQLDVSALHIDQVLDNGTDQEIASYLSVIVENCPELKAEVSVCADYSGPYRVPADVSDRVVWNADKLKRDGN